MNRLISLSATDVCVKWGGGGYKLVVSKGWSTAVMLQVPMWSPGMGILSYLLLFAMLMN